MYQNYNKVQIEHTFIATGILFIFIPYVQYLLIEAYVRKAYLHIHGVIFFVYFSI